MLVGTREFYRAKGVFYRRSESDLKMAETWYSFADFCVAESWFANAFSSLSVQIKATMVRESDGLFRSVGTFECIDTIEKFFDEIPLIIR